MRQQLPSAAISFSVALRLVFLCIYIERSCWGLGGVSNIKIDLRAHRVIKPTLLSYLNQLLRPSAANLKLFLYSL